MNQPRAPHPSEDWGIVLQSVPSKRKKEIVSCLENVFSLDKQDAEQVLSNMPLILVDNISFGLATRIKKHFQKLGAVAETTNHEMIKKNCFQIVWPQAPDLAFFLKDEATSAEVVLPAKKEEAAPMGSLPSEKKFERPEPQPEMPQVVETPEPVRPTEEPPASVMPTQPVVEEKPIHVDTEWERRAHDLNEKLRKIQEEKQQLHEQHAEVTEKVKTDFQQQLEQEKQKSDEIAKAYEDLRAQAEKQEALTREGEEWRSKAMALGERVRELETSLMQKTSAIEHLIQQKDDLLRQSEKASEFASRVEDLEKNITARNEEKAVFQARVSDFEKSLSAAQRELDESRRRDQEWSQKAGGLEREVQDMRESLRARDAALAQFETQMLELAEKVSGYEALRQQHSQLVQERAIIRKEYDVKLVEQEVRLAKVEEEHRRYRSRVDRKNAAATRELGEWVRGVDTVRQGLQKLILFLGSDVAVLDTEKKFPLRSPLTRGPDASNSEKI